MSGGTHFFIFSKKMNILKIVNVYISETGFIKRKNFPCVDVNLEEQVENIHSCM